MSVAAGDRGGSLSIRAFVNCSISSVSTSCCRKSGTPCSTTGGGVRGRVSFGHSFPAMLNQLIAVRCKEFVEHGKVYLGVLRGLCARAYTGMCGTTLCAHNRLLRHASECPLLAESGRVTAGWQYPKF